MPYLEFNKEIINMHIIVKCSLHDNHIDIVYIPPDDVNCIKFYCGFDSKVSAQSAFWKINKELSSNSTYINLDY